MVSKNFSNITKLGLEDVRDIEKLDMEKFCRISSMKKKLVFSCVCWAFSKSPILVSEKFLDSIALQI